MKILIVDDDPVCLALLVNALKDSYELVTAENGYDAVALAVEHTPDLILLDVMMPDLDGLQVCRLIRSDANLAETPVVFVTAVDSGHGEAQGLELGAVDYITKPINLKLAKLRIHNQMELKRQRNRIEAQNVRLTEQKAELEATLARVRRLEGILSICMHCRKIRTEENAWQQLEWYITTHTDARFSHGICPDCARTVWNEP